MTEPPLRLDEAGARRLLLVRAIDEVDTAGQLLAQAERDAVEQEVLAGLMRREVIDRVPAGPYLLERADALLKTVAKRQPSVAALAGRSAWERWAVWLLPVAACVLGTAIDRIDNPRQVNMLSPVLLAVLLWNLLAYLALFASLFIPRSRPEGGAAGALRHLAAALEPKPRGRTRAEVAGAFRRLWWSAAASLQLHRWRVLLHLTAAGWGAGLALSIVVGGLFREYRVGWESTLLDAGQVHLLLSLLFAPVVAVLPFDGFSAQDVAAMAFSASGEGGLAQARRWVWMYIGLLGIVVVAPRLLLAGWEGWLARRLGRAVPLDLEDGYFSDVLARVRPARVLLCVYAGEGAARERLIAIFREVSTAAAPADGSPWSVLTSARDDELVVLQGPPVASAAPADSVAPSQRGWFRRVLPGGRHAADAAAQDRAALDADVVLALCGEHERWPDALRASGKPVVWVRADDSADASGESVVLPAHWGHDEELLAAIGRRVPRAKQAAFGRLTAQWRERSAQRFAQSMRVIAAELIDAARELQALSVAPLSLRQLVSAGERQAHQKARQDAASAVLGDLRDRQRRTLLELLRLHGVSSAVEAPLDPGAENHLVVLQAVDAPQATAAGAASGAAMGAGIDLMTGGLTLGAAAALGALVGGAAAYTAAHRRNAAAPGGVSQVQVGDELLQSLAEAALLQYLRVAHHGRGTHELALPGSWRSEVVAAVETRRERLLALFAAARTESTGAAPLQTQLAATLQEIAQGLLQRLKPQ